MQLPFMSLRVAVTQNNVNKLHQRSTGPLELALLTSFTAFRGHSAGHGYFLSSAGTVAFDTSNISTSLVTVAPAR